jgi:diguanylate cyclase (GGDEF)-like protein
MPILDANVVVLEDEVVDDAFYDPLTGFPNKSVFAEHLGCSNERRKQHDDYLFAVLYLDLDHFKSVKDRLGDKISDRLLGEIARRIKLCLRSEDRVARVGQDQFTILLDDIKDLSDAARIAERIQKSLETPFKLDHQDFPISVSIGIAVSEKCQDNPEDLLQQAETAMYRAKSRGKARHEMFNPDVQKGSNGLIRLESALWRALERQDFRVYYQPIVSLETGKIIGAEALVRWQHPDRGLLPPSDFIFLAEETGLIVPINEWVLRTACIQRKQWQTPGHPQLHVAVNFTARQFQQPDLPESIRKVLIETDTPPQALELEITESTAIKNINSSARMLNELRSMGLQISIDDFGTGYSSMSYLKNFPADTLKIDQSFVRDIGSNANDVTLIKTIISMAHTLKLNVIAEGVETEDQLAFLLSHHCDRIQGFLFSQPLPAEEFTRLVKKGQSLSPEALNRAKTSWRKKFLGELLLESGFIDSEKLSRALKEKKACNEKLGQILMKFGYVNEDVLIEFLAKQRGFPGVNLYKKEIDKKAVNMIPRDVAEKYKVLPTGFNEEGGIKKLVVAMANPSDLGAIDTLGFITGHVIDPIFTIEEQFTWLLRFYY